MASPVEFDIDGRRIAQVGFYSGAYYILPAQSAPLIVLSEDLAFPVVNIKRRFGPYNIDFLSNAGSIEPIENIVSRDIERKLKENKRLESVNGFFTISSKRTKITLPGRSGVIAQREKEEIKYFLVNYSLTDKVLLRTLAGGRMY